MTLGFYLSKMIKIIREKDVTDLFISAEYALITLFLVFIDVYVVSLSKLIFFTGNETCCEMPENDQYFFSIALTFLC